MENPNLDIPKNSSQEKNYFGSKVLELELDTSTNDAITLRPPFANGFEPCPPFWTIWKDYVKPILYLLKFPKVFNFCHPSPFSFKMLKPKQK